MDETSRTLAVVELTVESGPWPAGTVGTVVDRHDDVLLVEVDDERGHALDYVEVPAAVARPIESPYTQPHLAP
jgi:hypothetical protein